jgi:hypothetical protein
MQQFQRIIFRKRGSRLSRLADFVGIQILQLIQNIWICVKDKWGRLGKVAVGVQGCWPGVRVARWKAWPSIEKCLLKFSIIVDLSGVTVFPSLSAVGSWEEVLLQDFTLSQNLLEFVLQDANFSQATREDRHIQGRNYVRPDPIQRCVLKIFGRTVHTYFSSTNKMSNPNEQQMPMSIYYPP